MKSQLPTLLAALLLFSAAAGLAQNTPADALTDLESHSLSRAPGTPAFHLKADFQANGNVEFKGAGTYEEWWLSPSRWRKDVTLGKYHLLLLCVDGKIYRDSTEDYIPMRVFELLTSVLPALPTSGELAHDGSWSVGPATVQNTPLVRLAMHGDPPKDGKLVPPEYAFYINPKEDVVQLEEDGFDLYFYDHLVKFADRGVMMEGKMHRNGQVVLEFHITSLAPDTTPEAALFQVPATAKTGFEFGIPSDEYWKRPVRVLGQLDRSKMRLRGAATEEIAVMQLDTTGAVREVDLMFSTDSIVADYLIYDLHHFKYAPTVVDGIPVTAYQTFTNRTRTARIWRSIR
jgi:hypothetical protein